MLCYFKKWWNYFSLKPEYNKKDNMMIVNIISEYPNLSYFVYLLLFNCASSVNSTSASSAISENCSNITLLTPIFVILPMIIQTIVLDMLPNDLLFSVVKGTCVYYTNNSFNLGVYSMFIGISRCRYSLKNILVGQSIFITLVFLYFVYNL